MDTPGPGALVFVFLWEEDGVDECGLEATSFILFMCEIRDTVIRVLNLSIYRVLFFGEGLGGTLNHSLLEFMSSFGKLSG